MRPTKVLSLLLLSLFAFGCGRGHSDIDAANAAKQKFEHFYAQWQKECQSVAYCNSTESYTGLPAFRSIVELGRPVLPCLRAKMEQDHEDGVMLAYAAAEICGWERSDFDARSDLDFQEMVLVRLRAKQ